MKARFSQIIPAVLAVLTVVSAEGMAASNNNNKNSAANRMRKSIQEAKARSEKKKEAHRKEEEIANTPKAWDLVGVLKGSGTTFTFVPDKGQAEDKTLNSIPLSGKTARPLVDALIGKDAKPDSIAGRRVRLRFQAVAKETGSSSLRFVTSGEKAVEFESLAFEN